MISHSSDARFALLMLDYPNRHDTFAKIWWGYEKRPLTRYICLDEENKKNSWWRQTIPDALKKTWRRDPPVLPADTRMKDISNGYPTQNRDPRFRRALSITLNGSEMGYQPSQYYGPFTLCPLHIGLTNSTMLGINELTRLRQTIWDWVDIKITALGLAYIANMGAI